MQITVFARMFRKLGSTAALVLALVALGVMAASPLHAAPTATLTVNSTKDTNDHSCDARGTGTGNKDCTLREAIEIANGTVGVQETIEFNIVATINTLGTCSIINQTCGIVLTSQLPDITDPIIINGYSEPGASANTLAVGDDAKPEMVLYGANLPTPSYGLILKGGKSTVQGFIFQKFTAAIALLSDKNLIAGNFVGTDYTGQSSVMNGVGIAVYGANNQIGGTSPAARNIISGNQIVGVSTSMGTATTVQGNYIGTNQQGTAALPNLEGIVIANSNQNLIGGKGAARNIISGNVGGGIQLSGTAALNKIQGNFIGLAADGMTALGNGVAGIGMNTDVLPVPIPNQLTILKNRIAHNGQNGIELTVSDLDVHSSVTISHNSISNNGALGIDLGKDGVTPNDKKDKDIGPSDYQNFPVLNAAASSGDLTTVQGTLNSTKSTTFRLEFFLSPVCDSSGYGQGSKYLGAVTVTTNGQGNASFTFNKSKKSKSGSYITATATRLVNGKPSSTSEFSKCAAVNS